MSKYDIIVVGGGPAGLFACYELIKSGSGDKGTPVVLIQGYFDDYTVE